MLDNKAVAVDSPSTCDTQVLVQVRLEVKKMFECPQTGQVLYPKLPFRKRVTDAGYDIYAAEKAVLPPSRATMVRTGIIISAPPGFYYTIEGRSSLWMQGIFPNRGIIDATFCGEISVSLVNVTGDPFPIKRHQRIAQIILHRQYDANFILVDDFSSIYNQRGKDGFGSSGE